MDALNGVVDSDAIHGELYHDLVSSPNHRRIPMPVCGGWFLWVYLHGCLALGELCWLDGGQRGQKRYHSDTLVPHAGLQPSEIVKVERQLVVFRDRRSKQERTLSRIPLELDSAILSADDNPLCIVR